MTHQARDEALRALLMDVVCDTEHPDRQIRASELLASLAQPAQQAAEGAPDRDDLERVLEDLVGLCNTDSASAAAEEVIAAEAVLERLYRARKAVPVAEPVQIIDSPETGWPSRIIDGKRVPCTEDGRLHESEPVPAEPMSLPQFFAEAKRIGLTANVFAAQLAERPEFADCVPVQAGALTDEQIDAVLKSNGWLDASQDEVRKRQIRNNFRRTLQEAGDLRLAAPSAEVGREVVAWANKRVSPASYVPYRTREEAQRSVDRSCIAATQEGPYEVVPLVELRAASAPSLPAAEGARDDLLHACEAAAEWLRGWASAEPYLSILEQAIAKAKATPSPARPVVVGLTEAQLIDCCGGCSTNSAIMTWMRRAIAKFCEVNGITHPTAGGDGQAEQEGGDRG